MDLAKFQSSVDKCLEHVVEDLSQIHTGRATPELVEGITVEAYGTQSPIKSLANINAADSRSLVIQPWDKSLLDSISKAISSSSLGFQASTEGEIVRVRIPDLTAERRQEFVKVMKEKIEDGRISVRNVRQIAMKEIDEAVVGGVSKDIADRNRAEVEKIVKSANEKIEEMRQTKEKELMTI